MSLINISLCLSDIPSNKVKQAANGKKYINLCLADRKDTGKYGETHTLFTLQTKEEREANEPTAYVGTGKQIMPVTRTVTAEDIESMPVSSSNDDLPF